MVKKKILLIEPYYAGSHKVLIDLLHGLFDCVPSREENNGLNELHQFEVHLAVMNGKKWHWRARTSALHFAMTIPKAEGFIYETVFASCVLPLHELLSLRPDLAGAKKIIYFHENQLVYPRRNVKDRDFQYGYNQIMSCLVADMVLFNSNFNMESFLVNMKSFFKLQPDYRPKNLRESVEQKCQVLYFPLDFAEIDTTAPINGLSPSMRGPIKILWPHRWEHDKNPEMFFNVILKLVKEGITHFRLSVLGENFAEKPSVFEEARVSLHDHIDHFGFLDSKRDYYQVLRQNDIVVSTADHEFFGVAVLEAAFCGCFPLCPDSLVYPEIFSCCPGSLFKSADDLYWKLKKIIADPVSFRNTTKAEFRIDFDRFGWKKLKSKYLEVLVTQKDSC